MPDFGRRDKAGLYHITHKQVADPFGILAIRLVPFLRFRIFGVCKGNETGFFKDVEDGDPILAGRLHTDIGTGIFGKPVSQFLKPFGKGRESGLFIFRATVGIRDTDAGIDPGFVDIKPTAVFTKDFKSQ